MKIVVGFAILVALCFAQVTANAGTVKQSTSGLCHPPQSSWYEKTHNYTSFDTIQACLDVGGRLPKGLSLASLSDGDATSMGNIDQLTYQRSAFGHGWSDQDGNCQDSRAEALIASSTTPVRFATERGCRVVTGRWISPFTGNVIQNASDIDIDHVVPLAWAWERGAKAWSQEKRERFANDSINLLPVESSLNRSKGAKGPDEWLPPSGQCGYVARFVRVLKSYDLNPTERESVWFQDFLGDCRR